MQQHPEYGAVLLGDGPVGVITARLDAFTTNNGVNQRRIARNHNGANNETLWTLLHASMQSCRPLAVARSRPPPENACDVFVTCAKGQAHMELPTTAENTGTFVGKCVMCEQTEGRSSILLGPLPDGGLPALQTVGLETRHGPTKP